MLLWIDRQPAKVQDKIFDAISRLEEAGFALRRPEVEYLGDDIYELRVRKGTVNYRPLYFFDDLIAGGGQVIARRAIIVHGCTKEARVSSRDLELAIRRRATFRSARANQGCTCVRQPTRPVWCS